MPLVVSTRLFDASSTVQQYNNIAAALLIFQLCSNPIFLYLSILCKWGRVNRLFYFYLLIYRNLF
jgi:hypothetical protein